MQEIKSVTASFVPHIWWEALYGIRVQTDSGFRNYAVCCP
ncbi:hypothetical protein H4S14_000875 [Agrobacterium vitis]|nr:hypothetical protein [Agrobacterium vitis]MBE1437148.1 hypothetical protein [Agrobacterium vitis]